MSMEWLAGRHLYKLKTSDDTVTYSYNADGLRTGKEDSNYKIYYYYDSNDNMIAMKKGGSIMYFQYDSKDNVVSMTFDGTRYYYVKNEQGDVEKIVDKSGNVVVTYKYDAWGNPCGMTDTSGQWGIGQMNPFRYRSYVYDDETGLYYLQSRYYDPITGRFLNADIFSDTKTGSPISTNMYSYCENNTVNLTDYNGFKPKKDFETYVKQRWGKNTFGDKKIRIRIKKNNIKINAYANISGKLKDKKIKDGDKVMTYGKLICKGIKKYWKGNFKIFNSYNVSLSTSIKSRSKNSLSIKASNKYGVSNVTYGSSGWRISSYGRMTIYKGDSRNKHLYTAGEFKRVAAHEFGHLIGLDDLYNGPKNVRQKYCCDGRYALMCHEFEASSINGYELRRVILAFTKNKYQYWT